MQQDQQGKDCLQKKLQRITPLTVATTIDEACQLLEAGFEYVTDIDGKKLFGKRKCPIGAQRVYLYVKNLIHSYIWVLLRIAYSGNMLVYV